MDEQELIQKQNKLLDRETLYRRIRLFSAIGGSLLFTAAGIGFSRGDRFHALVLLILTIIGYAIAADSHIKLFQIDSIRQQRMSATGHNENPDDRSAAR